MESQSVFQAKTQTLNRLPDAEQGYQGRGPQEVGVFVDKDPRRQREADVELRPRLAGKYGGEQEGQLRKVFHHGVVASDLSA